MNLVNLKLFYVGEQCLIVQCIGDLVFVTLICEI